MFMGDNMGFIPARCTQCGAEIKVDSSKEAGICEHCGTPFITEKVINNTYVTNTFNGATVNIISGDANNYLKLAETYLLSNNGNEAYNYASKALELQPNLTKAWMIKMRAISLCGKISDLKTKEIISCGKTSIDSSVDKVDVFSVFLGIAIEWLDIACRKIGDVTQLRLMASNGSNDLQMFASNDYEFRKLIYNYVEGAFELKKQVPNEMVTDNKILQGMVSELVSKYYNYCLLEKERCASYNGALADGEISLRRECLQQLQIGLPLEIQLKDELYELRNIKSQKGSCYIATAVYGSYDSPSVCLLRRFRDNNLTKNCLGRGFVKLYYMTSPYLVKCLGKNRFFLYISREILDRVVYRIKKHYRYIDEPYCDE